MNNQPLETIDVVITIHNQETDAVEYVPTEWDVDTMYMVEDESGNFEATVCPIDLGLTIKDYLDAMCMDAWTYWEATLFMEGTTQQIGWSSSEL
jgi:hypothetical protein